MTTSFFRIWTCQLQSPQKMYAVPMAILSCLFVSFPPSQTHHLPTFPNFPTSPFSHLSHLPNFTNFPPFPSSEPHHSPTFPIFPNSPPSHLQLKHFKIITLGLLSPYCFLREGSQYQSWKAKSSFSPPGKRSQTTGFEIWFTSHYTTEICSVWVT